MRYYPDADPYCYVETTPMWKRYCREPNVSWKPYKYQKPHAINYYRDLEGAKLKEITDQDLFLKGWQKSRIRPGACLPLYYGVGNRFIRLEKAPPAGFKCAPLPISLIEARRVREREEHKKKKPTKDDPSSVVNELIKKNNKKPKKKK